jgi:hypothetical protein
MSKLVVTIHDVSYPSRTLDVSVEATKYGLLISAKGYGDPDSLDGKGSPVILELVSGELRIVAWQDINNETPIILDLTGAKESKRIEEQYETLVTEYTHGSA